MTVESSGPRGETRYKYWSAISSQANPNRRKRGGESDFELPSLNSLREEVGRLSREDWFDFAA